MSTDFRDIYGSDGLYGLELTCQAWHELYAWVSGDYLSKTGESCLGYRTKAYFIPLGFGLKYLKLFSIDTNQSIGLYAGAGVLGTYLHTKDDSPFVVTTLHAWGVGGVVKGGILLTKDSLFLDLFTNYSFQSFRGKGSSEPLVYAHNTTINGWSFGSGLGVKF